MALLLDLWPYLACKDLDSPCEELQMNGPLEPPNPAELKPSNYAKQGQNNPPKTKTKKQT